MILWPRIMNSFNCDVIMTKRVYCVFFACFVFASTAQALASNDDETRILGGQDANTGEFPWTVSVRRNNAHRCMGSIISESHVITAGHCVSELHTTPVSLSSVSLRVGSINQFAGGSIVSVKEIVIHPSYGNFLHDIAILTLTTPLTFNERINKIDLPVISEGDDGELANGTTVYVQGFGRLLSGDASYRLQSGAFSTLSGPNCEYQAGFGYDSILCLQRGSQQGVCPGDDGAGVINNTEPKTLVGVISFHFGECGTKYPDISSKVIYYLDWIKAILDSE